MTLRLRRGTDAERESVVFAEGELIYTTDTKELYVGDGTTQGGVAAGGNGSGSGIVNIVEDLTPQLGGDLDLNNFEINGIGDIDITGSITADIINGGIFVGDGSGLTNIPVGDGVVEGSNYRINIVDDSSTLMVDTSTTTFTGNFVGDGTLNGNFTGQLSGTVIGDVIGSVFGDDSNLLIDGINSIHYGTFRGNLINENQEIIFNSINSVLTIKDFISTTNNFKFAAANINSTDSVKLEIEAKDNISILQLTRISDTDISADDVPYGAIYFERGDPISGFYSPCAITGRIDGLAFIADNTGEFPEIKTLKLTDLGDLGLGTYTPTAKLDVNGDAIVRGNLTIENGSLILDALDFELLDPERGLLVYDSDTDLLKLYDGEDWLSIISANPNNIAIFPGPIVIGPVSQNDIDEFGDDSSVVTGALIYNDTEDRFQFFQAGSWVSLPNNGSTLGQILAWDGTEWAATDPAAGSGTVENADLLNGFSGSFYLDYNNFTNTPAIPTSLTGLGISDGTSGQLLSTDGNGTFSFVTVAVGETNQNAFSNIAVSGQSTVVADSPTDTLTLVAGTGISITTNASTDTITITSATAFTDLSEVNTAGLTVDEIYLSAVTALAVTNSGSSAYLFDQYAGNNPTIYAVNGTTIAFDLNVTGHPFLIQTSTGTNFDTGLVHVAENGTVSTGSAAQGKVSGTLYWKIPNSIQGDYRYICSVHGSMVGTITIAEASSIGMPGLKSRASLAGSSGSIANSATANVNITGYRGYMLYKIETSAAAWVRLYVSDAARTADAGRTQGQDPLPSSGVIAEVITTGAETVIVAPGVVGFNNESPLTNIIPTAVTNLSGGSADITVTLTAVEMEI